ncbi:MAG: Crp/Fnr family transcriptional regulator [Cyclobacteriaceae bacterium]|nr:Crp/Fnr family transcriptional regulator [Cyclobacteriaceae bacterium]UYN85405.1 MAG: Crp/Fnr family transcriptional regulator [Cyclobacteriaceae bacterium]
MEKIKSVISNLVSVTENEFSKLLSDCPVMNFKRNEIVSYPGEIPQAVFFINKGIIRVTVTDNEGNEHTIHFALENQFIADYSSFILKQPALYALQALEDTEVVVMSRKAIEWGYNNMREGDRLGRLIAEFYFLYQDNRIKNLYARTPRERYDSIAEVFPNIHNRVPQHMIASYLGITPVHLSRLKKSDLLKS